MADPDPSSPPGPRRRRAPGHARFAISDAEEARLQAAIANNADNPELTDAQLAGLLPSAEVLPPALYATLIKRGRPKAETTKTPVKLRLDPDIVAGFKRTGPGWQTRINDALRSVLADLGGNPGKSG